jgi:NAD(P)-dependent dehydrogenase (short-subunit alcohol dehydrogenase family)
LGREDEEGLIAARRHRRKPAAAKRLLVTTRFIDDVVMVTGASGLIGSACVAAFLELDARVVAVGGRNQILDGARNAGIPPSAFASEKLMYLQADLGIDAELERIVAAAEERFGPVSVLVNNAAVYGRRAYQDLSRDDLIRVYSVNVFAPILLSRRVAKTMIENGVAGRIVNITSTSSQQSDPFSVGYDSSKGAVDAATRAMAVALGQFGITVNAVGPGEMIKSQETDNLRSPTALDAFERRRIPIGRVATPQEVAEAVLFLASNAGRGISGSIIWVDGGTLGTWTTPHTE